MSYFQEYNSKINLKENNNDNIGLRNAQIGAYHSIGAFFTLNKTEPAIITMPTGTGKTAVLILAAFLLKAKRVLVISSSVLVRGQIVNEFKQLDTLKRNEIFPAGMQAPKVFEVKGPIKSKEQWEEFINYDVIVGIPNSINEGINENFSPPADIFDLILVDEAHHTPAYTWSNTIKHFIQAKKVFFTATPFRRDKKEIEGKLAYTYPLSKAYEDKVFGEISYVAVKPNKTMDNDLLLAKETEKVFKKDQAQGLEHYLLVRTNTKDRADSLEKLYKDNTTLKLKKVHSRLSFTTIQKTIKHLKEKKLDGIICVNMLGEGFDFPNLKIAAIHNPQKSLATTLQFIGRFARTNAEHIGEAKFIAFESDIEIGKLQLFKENAIWIDLIRNISEDRIEQEGHVKEVISTFSEAYDDTIVEPEDISLYNLRPYSHVRIYRTNHFNNTGLIVPQNHEVVKHVVSKEHNSTIVITVEKEKPKWISSNELVNAKYHLFLVYYDEETNLLFLHSSIKTPAFYDEIIEQFCDKEPLQVSKEEIHKVLINLKNPRFFNLGLLNRSSESGESYITKAGSDTQNTITASDGRMYANGHVFGTAESDTGLITIGYSSGAKVWSNSYSQVPHFIKWCKTLAHKINSDEEVKTNTSLDTIPIAKVIDKLPVGVFPYFGKFNNHSFKHSARLIIYDEDKTLSNALLSEVDINILMKECNEDKIPFELYIDQFKIDITFSFSNHYQINSGQEYLFKVEYDHHNVSLQDYLNHHPIEFILDDFSTLFNNNEFIKGRNYSDILFDKSKIMSFDWDKYRCDIEKEFGSSSKNGKISIHDTLEKHFTSQKSDIIIYDHGTGETADFIVIKESAISINIELYHVKASGNHKSGDRVNDVYEVSCQCMKSLLWTVNKQVFKNKIERRTKDSSSKFIKGNLKDFCNMIDKTKSVKFSIVMVQPGISQNSISGKIEIILAATNDYIRSNGNNDELRIWGS